MHKSSTNAPDEARRCLDLPSKDGGDRIYFNGSNIAVEDAGAQYGTNGSENSPETAGSAADRQQENTKALLRLAESIENAAGCGIIGITKYSDSQPRDDHGRWTDGGGGDSGGASGGTSPLKDSGYEYKKITDDAIKNVPRVNIFDDDEMNTRYQQANKDLLKEAQKHPVGTEVSIVYGADMKPIKDHSYRVGEIDGEVKIDNPDQPYHAFHNHPSGNTFSPDDMLRFQKEIIC